MYKWKGKLLLLFGKKWNTLKILNYAERNSIYSKILTKQFDKQQFAIKFDNFNY